MLPLLRSRRESRMLPKCMVLVLLMLIGPSLWAADHDVSIASISVPVDKRWDWTLFIKGTPDALTHVSCVGYVLEPSFPNRSRTVCNRGDEEQPFNTKGTTWGPFKLTATVTFDDKTVQELQYTLNPQQARLPDVLTGRWRLNAQKSSPGGGAEYRTYRRVGDSIEVSFEHQPSYIIVCDGQIHKTNRQDISCSFTAAGGFQGHQEPPLRYFVDEVSGDTLTISTYSDAEHTTRILMLVFDRDVPVP
jgi:hypothetical protein